jgi:glycosyltransferase involved in cell wall biosynthesis
MLDVSIFILSYNRPGYLREAVESVILQSQTPSSIAIFDNGSAGEVQEAVRDFIELGVRWFGSDVNRGSHWNTLRAIDEVSSKYFMLLHDDDRLDPFFLERQIRFMEQNNAVSAVSCNGHLIDYKGVRLCRTLAPSPIGDRYHFFSSSGEVALKYAGNSCIPLSPTIYRTSLARSVTIREEFGKVADAVLFCDLTTVGPIAYLEDPLYECRIHPGQDSIIFPEDLMNKLELFFETRELPDEALRSKLVSLLTQQHTARNLKLMFISLRHKKIRRLIELYFDKRFKLSLAFYLMVVHVGRYFRAFARRIFPDARAGRS